VVWHASTQHPHTTYLRLRLGNELGHQLQCPHLPHDSSPQGNSCYMQCVTHRNSIYAPHHALYASLLAPLPPTNPSLLLNMQYTLTHPNGHTCGFALGMSLAISCSAPSCRKTVPLWLRGIWDSRATEERWEGPSPPLSAPNRLPGAVSRTSLSHMESSGSSSRAEKASGKQ
jgi:hypothetical protein